MVSTFLDLWKQWRGANRNLILNGGKERPPEAKVLPMHRQHGGARHTLGLPSTRELGEAAGATAAGDTG